MMKWCIVSSVALEEGYLKALDIKSTVFHEHDVIDYTNALNNKIAVVRTGVIILNYKNNYKEPLLHEMYFPGDIIGPISKRLSLNQIELKPIETSSLCFFDNLLLEQQVNVYVHSLKKQLSFFQEIQMYNKMLLMQRNPAKRVALFLLTIIEKKKLVVYDNIELKINLSRLQIGFYLGLVEETVVRALRQLSQLELLKVSGKHFIISNYQKLSDFFMHTA